MVHFLTDLSLSVEDKEDNIVLLLNRMSLLENQISNMQNIIDQQASAIIELQEENAEQAVTIVLLQSIANATNERVDSVVNDPQGSL